MDASPNGNSLYYETGVHRLQDFFNLTGVDLLITGTNVTKQRSGFFSVGFTPPSDWKLVPWKKVHDHAVPRLIERQLEGKAY